MNLSLDPNFFTQGYPEGLTRSLGEFDIGCGESGVGCADLSRLVEPTDGHSVCVKFNRIGDYLASGQSDGAIIIYDYDTYGVIKVLRGHVASIQSLR